MIIPASAPGRHVAVCNREHGFKLAALDWAGATCGPVLCLLHVAAHISHTSQGAHAACV